jgi:hypothetical protein
MKPQQPDSLMKTAGRARLLLALLAFASPLAAAPVKFLPWDDDIALRKIGFSDGKEVTELQELHPHKRSKPVAWNGGEGVPQLVALDRPGADGKPSSVPVKIAAGMKSPLVLILPDRASPAGLRAFVIEDSPERFGWGNLRFINATGKALLVRQDKLVKELPAAWTPVDLAPGGEARNVGVMLAAKADTTAVLYSSVWEHHPEVRKLVFVIPGEDVRTGALDLKIIPEDRRTLAAPPAEPAPAEPAGTP